jgi:hypothetical protein
LLTGERLEKRMTKLTKTPAVDLTPDETLGTGDLPPHRSTKSQVSREIGGDFFPTEWLKIPDIFKRPK